MQTSIPVVLISQKKETPTKRPFQKQYREAYPGFAPSSETFHEIIYGKPPGRKRASRLFFSPRKKKLQPRGHSKNLISQRLPPALHFVLKLFMRLYTGNRRDANEHPGCSFLPEKRNSNQEAIPKRFRSAYPGAAP